jgi:small subunit ribosomal protein S16
MPVKIRLSRHGRKRKPFYHIVVTDSRAPRDGRFIENLGKYNPNTNPATIDLNFEKALDWVQKGAQPTDTCRAILSYKGVMYKKHLLEGVKKNAFSEEEAEKKFQDWLTQKEAKIEAKRDSLSKKAGDAEKARLAAEKKISDARAEALAKRNSDLAEAAAAETAEDVAEEVAEVTEAPAEAVAEEAPVAEEAKEETPAEEPKAEPVAEEVKKEAPVEEVKEIPVSEETPEAETETKEEKNTEA